MTVPADAVLRYLADLAPDRWPEGWDRAPRQRDFVLLDPGTLRAELPQAAPGGPAVPSVWIAREGALEDLAALDDLHETERLLRLGWLFLTGTAKIDGRDRRLFLPLASGAVTVEGGARSGFRLTIDGDMEVPIELLAEDRGNAVEEGLEEVVAAAFASGRLDAGAPGLGEWVATFAAAAGLPAPTLLPADRDPFRYQGEGLAVSAAMAAYLARDPDRPGTAGALRAWAGVDTAATALHAVYVDPASMAPPHGGDEAIVSPLPLNERQREAVARSRRESVTVVSGPPGTGKSHLVAALAIDEVARGHSVLVATQTDFAADVLAGLLERTPGPRYVRFGSSLHRHDVADDLAGGLAVPYDDADVARILQRVDEAERETEAARRRIVSLLEIEAALDRGLRRRQALAGAAAQAPGVLDPRFDPQAATRFVERRERTTGLFARWRSRRAERRLRAAIAARPDASWEDVRLAVEAGAAEAAVRRGLAGGGLSLVDLWHDLERAEERWRAEYGRMVETVRRARLNSRRHSTRSVAALASVLRAGRARRRRMLRDLRGGDFLDVLPLWLGSLADIDSTLPVEAGIFDVVVFDEASQIDQLRSAPALARARRAVVVGDPRQLRHVSFVSDDAMQEAAARHGLDPETARVGDVRRNSLFDVAASAGPVTWLDEHFRSVPHIIGFSDRTFYGGGLRLMTQHPGTETTDAIRVVTVTGARSAEGVNHGELRTVLAEVEEAVRRGVGSVGVISPFRAQADALETALRKAFTREQIKRHGIRVGTVHGFQGAERDVMIASLVVGRGDAAARRFLEDPHLFNVLVTRARHEMVVVTSLGREDAGHGLLADYLKHADEPPLPSQHGAGLTGWLGDLADALAEHGIRRVAGYPVAGWTVDLAVGEGSGALGVECRVHEDGPETHIDRHQALRRAGWHLRDAYQSRWLSRPEAAVQELAAEVLRRAPRDG